MGECKLKKELAALLACAIFSGCAHAPPAATVGGQLKPDWKIASDAVYLRTRGIGVPPKDVHDAIERRALARKAALIDARYEMAALIEGAQLQGGYTIGDLETKDSNVKEVENDLIAGAEESETEWLKDGACVVTLQIKRSVARKMLDQIIQVNIPPTLSVQPMNPNHDRHKAILMSTLFPGLGSVYYGNRYNMSNEVFAGLGYMIGAGALVGIGAAEASQQASTSQEGSTSASQAKANRALGDVLMGLGAAVWAFGIDDAYELPTYNMPQIMGGTLIVYPQAHGAAVQWSRPVNIWGGFAHQ